MVYTDGSEYNGFWDGGVRCGRGKHMYSSSGDMWEGEWEVDERKDGAGVMHYSMGDTYSGEWVREVAAGAGEYVEAGGNHYKGAMAFGRFEGEGEMLYT